MSISRLAHEAVDRLPTQVNYTSAMGSVLSTEFDLPSGMLTESLDNHLLRVDIASDPRISEDGRTTFDWWGVGWSTEEEGYFVTHAPLASAKSSAELDAYPWPDPGQPQLLQQAHDNIEADGGERFVIPNLGFALFERAWSLRGFERLLMDLALNEGFVEALLERITEVQVRLARRYTSLGVDGGYFGDDYGSQNGLLFSPSAWRRLIRPRLARLCTVFREVSLPVILHSDGAITEIIPDLVDVGVTALNPVQPEVLDHQWLKRTYGKALAFYGGVSTQTVLPHGTPNEVRVAVHRCVSDLAADGTGLIVAPSHRLMKDVPISNVLAFVDAIRDQGVTL